MALQASVETRRAEAEMAIAILREELNRALSYRRKYNADGHNLCLALVDLTTGGSQVMAAYSNDSAIPHSLRLHLDLVPDTYALLPAGSRFGCDGMAQLHTEPKLLNFLTAQPAIRQQPFAPVEHAAAPPGQLIADYRDFVAGQRRQAQIRAQALPAVQAVKAVTLVSEIDCCPTCRAHSIERFRARYPDKPLSIIELGKVARAPTGYREVTISRTTSG